MFYWTRWWSRLRHIPLPWQPKMLAMVVEHGVLGEGNHWFIVHLQHHRLLTGWFIVHLHDSQIPWQAAVVAATYSDSQLDSAMIFCFWDCQVTGCCRGGRGCRRCTCECPCRHPDHCHCSRQAVVRQSSGQITLDLSSLIYRNGIIIDESRVVPLRHLVLLGQPLSHHKGEK